MPLRVLPVGPQHARSIRRLLSERQRPVPFAPGGCCRFRLGRTIPRGREGGLSLRRRVAAEDTRRSGNDASLPPHTPHTCHKSHSVPAATWSFAHARSVCSRSTHHLSYRLLQWSDVLRAGRAFAIPNASLCWRVRCAAVLSFFESLDKSDAPPSPRFCSLWTTCGCVGPAFLVNLVSVFESQGQM